MKVRHAIRRRAILPGLLLGTLTACGGGAPEAGPDTLAVAHTNVLTVDEAVGILTAGRELPLEPDLVLALGELWAEYTLLAFEAREDPTLESLDISPLLDRSMEQALVRKLREEVISVDTAMTDEELQTRFEADAPGARTEARHILLTFPEQATDAQRDSVLAFAAELKSRAEAGEDFGELARAYSRDPGSAARGGDLGFFPRGQMVRPFEEAAFATPVGQIADPVESPFGVHVIQVTDRELIPFDSVKLPFRQQVQQQMVVQAESLYIASLMEPANISVAEDGPEIMRELARDVRRDLNARAARRPVVTYDGGEVTAGEVQNFLKAQSPQVHDQISQAEDGPVDGVLRQIAEGEILVAEARGRGFQVTPAETDSVEAEIRGALREVVESLGLAGITPADGQTPAEAIDGAVKETIGGIISGQVQVQPLGLIASFLRDKYGAVVNAEAVDPVLAGMAEAFSAPAAGDTTDTGSGG